MAELLTYGWGIVGLGIIGSLLISKAPWKNKNLENRESEVA